MLIARNEVQKVLTPERGTRLFVRTSIIIPVF